ncbi:ABC transporter substrate-binding protein [Pseudomonas syringae]|uniref:ABC transporter substrate-binding protein n=1 Tax=Pseudomonas syringae TaxID=317 RepID=UPI0003FE8EC4|nr:ABC transporter substrate-binding protein [Pseudomonas syringae]QGG74442.1 ABC transporter substrate-binding protein [Pseudomonas syringae USA011]
MRAFRLPHLLACGLLTLIANVAQAAPIDIDDGQHKVHLPDTPKRVVVLEFSFLDGLASVGVTPVGAADDGDANRVLPKVRKAVGEWQSVGLRSQPNIEVIARLKPDLIIADLGRHQALYNDLASLAPTLMLPSRGEDYQGSLKSAEQIPANSNVLFGVAREDSFSVHGPHSYAGSVLQAIGLKVPEVRKNAAPTEFVSLEQLLALDPGWLLVGHYRRPSIVDSWSKQPLWQVLGAVRNKQVAEVDGDSWARNRGIMASEQIADDALAVIKGGKAVLNP